MAIERFITGRYYRWAGRTIKDEDLRSIRYSTPMKRAMDGRWYECFSSSRVYPYKSILSFNPWAYYHWYEIGLANFEELKIPKKIKNLNPTFIHKLSNKTFIFMVENNIYRYKISR